MMKDVSETYDKTNAQLTLAQRKVRFVIAETKVLNSPALGSSMFGLRSLIPGLEQEKKHLLLQWHEEYIYLYL